MGVIVMGSTRSKMMVACICAVALVAGVVLFFALRDRNDIKETVRIPEVPEGSVLIWCLTEEYDVDENGKQQLLFESKYDDTGRCVSAKHYVLGGTTSKAEKLSYEYDLKTHYIREVILDEGLVMYETIDSAGRTRDLRYQTVEKSGALGGGKMYVLDENARFVSETFYNEEGAEESKRTHDYDSCGYEISRIRIDVKTGEEQVVRRAELDDRGRALRIYERDYDSPEEKLILEAEYAADGSRLERSYTYDDSGNPRIKEYNANGDLVTDIIYRETDDGGIQTDKTVIVYKDGREATKTEYLDDEISSVTTTVYEQGDHSSTVTVTEEYTNIYGEKIKRVKTETCCYYGDSLPEEEKYESREIRNYTLGENEVRYGEEITLYEFKYDEYGNRIAYRKTKTADGETRYCHGGCYVYKPMVITKEQAAENAEFYDYHFHQVLDEVGSKDANEDWIW